MRKLIAIGLAGALATASVGVTTTSAKADPVSGAVIVAAVVVGVLLLTHHVGPFKTLAYYELGVDDGHTAWCKARYKTYNATTDTFIGNDLRPHRCISP
jgi:hypothetical protein